MTEVKISFLMTMKKSWLQMSGNDDGGGSDDYMRVMMSKSAGIFFFVCDKP